jgi:hypothetical protein
MQQLEIDFNWVQLPQDDNLIRLMLQPPKTGKDDPLWQRSEIINRKRFRVY